MEKYGVNPKFGTKKWFENYWFHYKWHTIGGLFAAFLAGTFIYDIITRERYDAEVSVNAQAYISSEQTDRLHELLSLYATDADGNGEANVGVFVNTFPPDESADPQLLVATQTKFTVEISDGNSMLLIMDDYAYDWIGDPAFFEDLSSYSDKAYDGGIKIRLADTPLSQDPLLAPLGEQLYITMRASDSHLVTKKGGDVRYAEAQTILKNLLSDSKPQSPAAPA